ncbi:MAG: hypothetical protein CL669_05890 [Balneola sp.]|nr:hypothetical protein [Balneola sp.]
MALTQVIQLRNEFEDLTRGYNMPEGSSIDNIEWFIENGHRSNSLRNGFADAMKIARRIKEYYYGSSKKTRKRKRL